MLTAGEAHRAMEVLPLADLDAILAGADPLVLAPHADDESLGCGGLLAGCVARGGRPSVLVLTDGTGSHPSSRAYPPARLRVQREQEARVACGILGVAPDRVGFLGLRDTAAPVAGPDFEAAVQAIAAALQAQRCGVLLAPWRHDPHCDHEAAHLMAAAVARRTGARHLAYPVWGWTLPPGTPLAGPAPQGWRLDITPYLPAKRRAVAAYLSQYSDLITDDPAGFRLPPALLARFGQPFETFLDPP